MGAVVKSSPTAPPIILRPLMCLAVSGKVEKSRPMFVKVPVATTHAVSREHAMRASCISTIALQPYKAFFLGEGSKSVPSRPDSPATGKWEESFD